MIRFGCPHCGKRYSLADDLAGRSARCKACGKALVIPSAPASTDPVQPSALGPIILSMKPHPVPMRIRRLTADAEFMQRAFTASTHIRVVSTTGSPPELYVIEYRVRSLMRGPGGAPVYCDHHQVQIQLTLDYPRQSPKCKMLTPIFHPNIEPAVICVGDHWTAGERLVDLVIRIGEMLAYQLYNLKSPLDGEAAMWADLHRELLPTHRGDLRPPDFA